MNNRSIIFTMILAVLVLYALATPASAQLNPIKGFLIGGYYTEPEDLYLGAGVSFDLLKVQAAGYFDYIFIDRGSLYDINVDLYYNALSLVAVFGYIGAGGALVFANPEEGNTQSKPGLNLVAGLKTRLIPLKPFVQLKYTFIQDLDDPLAIGIGIQF